MMRPSPRLGTSATRVICLGVDGWRRAVLSYNHSESYVDDVAKLANSYHS